MKTLRIGVFTKLDEHVNVITNLLAAADDVVLTIYREEEKVIEAISAQSFDALLLDKKIDTLEQNRLLKMAELVYPESVYTTISMELPSFATLKINQLLADWKAAQQDQGGFQFHDNPEW